MRINPRIRAAIVPRTHVIVVGKVPIETSVNGQKRRRVSEALLVDSPIEAIIATSGRHACIGTTTQ